MKNNMDHDSFNVISITDEMRENNNKYSLNKFDYDLHKEEDNVVEKIIRVKRFSVPNKGERWKIFEDNKIVMIIEGSKLSKNEKEFLYSIEGIQWLLSEYKQGIKSFNSLKKNMKARLLTSNSQ